MGTVARGFTLTSGIKCTFFPLTNTDKLNKECALLNYNDSPRFHA